MGILFELCVTRFLSIKSRSCGAFSLLESFGLELRMLGTDKSILLCIQIDVACEICSDVLYLI